MKRRWSIWDLDIKRLVGLPKKRRRK